MFLNLKFWKLITFLKKCSHLYHHPWLSVMVWTDFSWDVYLFTETSHSSRGVWPAGCGGQGSALWTWCRLSRPFEGNKATRGHRFPTHWPSIVQRSKKWRGGSAVMCFMGWRWWPARPVTSARSQRRKQTYALFQWALNHEGQLVVFQFIKWIWTLALWSRLVLTDVKSHPSKNEATRQRTKTNGSYLMTQVLWSCSQIWV